LARHRAGPFLRERGHAPPRAVSDRVDAQSFEVAALFAATGRSFTIQPIYDRNVPEELNRSRGRALRGVARPVAYTGERLSG
jgi:hypothetical protein